MLHRYTSMSLVSVGGSEWKWSNVPWLLMGEDRRPTWSYLFLAGPYICSKHLFPQPHHLDNSPESKFPWKKLRVELDGTVWPPEWLVLLWDTEWWLKVDGDGCNKLPTANNDNDDVSADGNTQTYIHYTTSNKCLHLITGIMKIRIWPAVFLFQFVLIG